MSIKSERNIKMQEIISKLKKDIHYSLSTKDFETLGFSFESFLRYGQVSQEKVVAFHKVLIQKFDK